MQVMSSRTPTPPRRTSSAGPHRADGLIVERSHRHAPSLIGVRESAGAIGGDRGQLGARLVDRRAAFEPAGDGQVVKGPSRLSARVEVARLRRRRQRNPEIGLQRTREAARPQHRSIRKREVLRHDAGNRGRGRRAKAHGAPGHVWIAVEPPPPVLIAEDHPRGGLAGAECLSDHRGPPEEREHSGRDRRRLRHFGFTVHAELHAGHEGVHRLDARER